MSVAILAQAILAQEVALCHLEPALTVLVKRNRLSNSGFGELVGSDSGFGEIYVHDYVFGVPASRGPAPGPRPRPPAPGPRPGTLAAQRNVRIASSSMRLGPLILRNRLLLSRSFSCS